MLNDPVVINRRKLFEQVAAHLEQEILAGKFKPGDRLPPERDLQEMFGVGRPAIREALITLQRVGLLEISNGAPARVAMPTVQGIVTGLTPAVQQILSGAEGQRQLQRVRLFMEVGLVRNAATDATDQEVQAFADALDDNRRAVGNVEDFIRTDVAFHYVLATMMHNQAFLALHDAMSTWLLEQRRIALIEPGEDTASHEAHVRIYEAVAARDADAAEPSNAATS
ncbi:GntR family transcriptional regulator [Devosia algicola]|uniref:GntR family transcriptional regulator n=1 Tax=Devosia algicola TaxID=3026418 RepID=A0ABY7YR02_9HYPH|nr:GntR family transcriptional regulator [Devosia algicola]WDR03553.1 GntR family transcriptional regulator [Devosia algicola]